MDVSHPKAMRALAHPLRLDLLELLTSGPATAAQCGRILGVPQANCSFHLRQLAKYGFVEDAGPGADRRERQWRVAEQRPRLRVGTGADAAVRRQFERVVVEREARAILDYTDRREDEAAEWREAASIMTGLVAMAPEDVKQLRHEWYALLQRYAAKFPADATSLPPEHRRVRIFMAATPLPTTTPDEPTTVGEDDDNLDR
ncbi:helix-turn-helix domain-containing protein [Micromonospora sp. MS34]|uniref:helix-turn-helix domain-containing protein n=1 Tax=Micromonospora sp. MS34 TaxID=3385971 RepID=UPI0039A18636